MYRYIYILKFDLTLVKECKDINLYIISIHQPSSDLSYLIQTDNVTRSNEPSTRAHTNSQKFKKILLITDASSTVVIAY